MAKLSQYGIASAKAFLNKIDNKNRDFVKELEQCKTVDARMNLLKRYGFIFTNSELGTFKNRYDHGVWHDAWYHDGSLISYNLTNFYCRRCSKDTKHNEQDQDEYRPENFGMRVFTCSVCGNEHIEGLTADVAREVTQNVNKMGNDVMGE
jgi:hypothetical protein